MSKKTLRLSLEWGAYPLWILDDNGIIIGNEEPCEIKDDVVLLSKLDELQDTYESLFINNKIEFKYIGDQKPEEFRMIKVLYENIAKEIKEKLGNTYNIEVFKLYW